MKKIIFIIIVALLIIVGFCFLNNNEELENNNMLANDISHKSNLENKIDLNEIPQNKVSDNKVSKDEITFDSNKMKSDASKVIYEEDDANRGNAGIQIEIKNGKAYLSTDVEDETYQFLFSEITTPIKDKEITGFSSNVVDVYFAFMGNGDMTPMILFLMEDGSVEFVDSNKMIKFKKYQSFGKIKELSNIVKFVNLIANDIDENGEKLGGFITVVAIDEEGYAYDLSASKTIQDEMLSSTR